MVLPGIKVLPGINRGLFVIEHRQAFAFVTSVVRKALCAALVGAATLLCMPGRAVAQTGSGIAGLVKDTTGAVLPGVTVEASSPVLIEKVRTVVTDGQGQYKIIDLVPGVYTVTFALAGFNTVKREGIELPASFTATVNAELRVGSLEETLTVTSQAPTVDVQNVVQRSVMSRDVVDAVPLGSKAVISIAVLIPGVVTNNQDVGGTAYTSSQIAIHGGRQTEQQLLYDGMFYNNGQGVGGTYTGIVVNDGTVQEVSLETGALSAESSMGGVRTNVIPRDGGNTFNGLFFGAFTNQSLQGNNLTSDLIARGITATPRVTRAYDFDPAFGGPLVKDKLWFWGSYRRLVSDKTVAGIFFNASPTPYRYVPNLGAPAQNNEENGNESVRLTAQVSPRNKVNVQFQDAQRVIPGYGYALNSLLNTPEATMYNAAVPDYFGQVGWTSPVTNRLLLEGGFAFVNKDYVTYTQPGIDPLTPAYTERSTGISWGNLTQTYGHNASHQYNAKFATSYVTGSHAVKVGVTFMHTYAYTTSTATDNGVTLQLLNGVPNQVTVFATPLQFAESMKANVGLFAQDQWTIRHLTLNAGIRYDSYNAYAPAGSEGPVPNAPTRNYTFAPVYDVPNWKNVLPRLGAAYDLFGDGKTAIKASISKYVEGPTLISFTRLGEPAAAIITSTTRTWSDANGDFVPQCNFANPVANGECGPIQNKNFDTQVVSTQYDPSALTNRGTNWEVQAGIQHELLPAVSVAATYVRRWYQNLRATQNTDVTSANFSPYCITAPTDSRLPGGGGNQICGFYDVNPAQFGLSNNVISVAPQLQDVYDGIDLTANVRLPRGIVLQGGVSTGRERTNDCFELNDLSLTFTAATAGAASPRTSAFCDVRPPFQPNLKFLAIYPLPWWGLQASAAFQSLPGPQITASETVTNAQIAPSLGRNLSTGVNGTATLDLIAPGTMYGDRLNQLDLRGAKSLKVGPRLRIQGMVDLYNALNASPVISQNNTYGSAWERPTLILQPRLVKFSVQLNF
jgi:hypothetical protein